MIRITITADEAANSGLIGVVQKLRAAGIPVRASIDNELRLCKVWTPDGKKCLGYGGLERFTDSNTKATEFCYWPPVEPDVIDVEAREVVDVPRLT